MLVSQQTAADMDAGSWFSMGGGSSQDPYWYHPQAGIELATPASLTAV